MKPALMLLTLAASLALTGCDDNPALLSLDPIVTDQETTFDAALLGVWGASDGKDIGIFRRSGDSAYAVTYASDGNARQFEARLFRVGEARYLDLAPEIDDSFLIPGHALVRVWIEDDTFRWTFVDSGWLTEQAGRQLPNRMLGEKRMLLTAPGPAIRGFLASYGADDNAHGKIEEWRKVR
jgi:hypothetical protein